LPSSVFFLSLQAKSSSAAVQIVKVICFIYNF